MTLTLDQLDEAISVANKHIRKEIISQLETTNYLYNCLTTKGKTYISGGTKIQQPIIFKENESQGFIDGKFDVINTNTNQQITYAIWPWKYYGRAVNITMDEIVKTHNTSEAVKSLLIAKKQAAVASSIRDLSRAMHGSGTDNNGKSFNGFADIFSASGIPYGGISNEDIPEWITIRDSSSSEPNYPTISKMISKLNARANQYGGGMKNGFRPDIIISNNAVQNAFMSTLQAQQRFIDKSKLQAGFQGVDVNGLFWYVDEFANGSADGTADNHIYVISSNTFKFFYKYGLGKKSPFDQEIQLPNQTIKSDQAFIAGNIGCVSRRLNGVFTSIIA